MEKMEKKNKFVEKGGMVFENFDVCYDKNTKEFLEEDVKEKFSEIKEFVDNVLGLEWEIDHEKVKVYLFSDEKQYLDYLSKNFPDVPKGSATFDSKTNSIFNYTSVPEQDKDKTIYQANMLSGIAHELGHLHPFFGGVGNRGSKNKWEQEMVCNFIGEKIRTKFGNENLRNIQLKKAQEEVKTKSLSWKKAGDDWENFTSAERFVYPWLEKKYGLEKLQDLWHQLFKEKKTLPEAIKDVYETEISDLEDNFEKDILEAKDYKDVEE